MLSLLLEIQTVPVTGENAVDFTWLFIKMLMVLGVVSVLAIIILKYAVPHFGFTKHFQKGNYFKVLGRYSLEPRRALYLITVGGRYFVIGSSDHGVNLVTELSEKEAVEGVNYK